MSTEGTIDYNSLSWVKKQLDTILAGAQEALSEYIENSDDTSLMQKCVDELKLVYGTLQMVEVYGAAMLADEMLQTANAQLSGDVEKPEDVFDVLMRAMLQLPDYLEGIQSGNKDTPIVLLPLMNDLRTARKENLLSESVLFLPDVESVEVDYVEPVAPVEQGRLQAEAKRLRTHYQVGLLDLLKNKKEKAGLQRMSAVLLNLEKFTSDNAVKKLWMVASALLESLRDEGVDVNISVKMLLGSVDRQIKQLFDDGEQAFANHYSQDLLKNLLYYVGRSTSEGSRVSSIKQAYKLNELLPSEADTTAMGSGMAGLNSELFDTVSHGIREDLAAVKDALEIFVQSTDADVQSLQPLSEQLLKIGDTYGMLSLGAAREKILAQKETVDAMVSGQVDADEAAVMEIASNLLQAESALNTYIAERAGLSDSASMVADSNIPAAEYRQVLDTVVGEGLKNFSAAKEAVLMFTSGAGSREQLDIIAQKLEEMRGILAMLPMDSVKDQLDKLIDYVNIALINNRHEPDESEQDTLADVVTSIEYYFEAMTEGRPGVEQSLRAGDEAANRLALITSAFPQDTVIENDDIEEDVENDAVVDSAIDLEVITSADSAETSGVSIELEDFTEDAPAEQDASTVAAEVSEPSQTGAAAVDTSEYESYEILGDDPDEEILEIFIEEAVEVLEEMHANLPKWIANREDEESLTVVRRNFHTLKGSGRLVGAQLIGEFSWKFENMLNKVIENKIEPNDALCSTVEEALSVLPQLIEQLKGNREPVHNVYELMALTDALSEGRELVDSAKKDEPAGQVEPELEQDVNAEAFEAITDNISEESLELSMEDIAGDPEDIESNINKIVLDELAEDAFVEDSVIAFEEQSETADQDNAESVEIEASEAIELSTNIASDDMRDDIAESFISDDSEEIINLSIEEVTASDDEYELLNTGIASLSQNDDEAEEISAEVNIDPTLFKIYYDESQSHIKTIRTLLAQHKSGEQLLQAEKDLIRAFHTLYGSARTADIESIANLCGVSEKYVKTRNTASDTSVPEKAVIAIEEVVDTVSGMLELVKQGTMPEPDKNLHDTINKLMQDELQRQLQVSSNVTTPATEVTEISTVENAVEEAVVDEAKENNVEAEQVETVPAESATATIDYSGMDDDLIDIFLEEADELIESCESSLLALRDKPEDAQLINRLQRYMHTLKGGARMAELSPVGDLTHALESLVVKWSEHKINGDQVLFDHLNESLDALNGMLGCVKQRQPLVHEPELVERLEVLTRGGVPEQRVVERFDVEIDELKGADIDDDPIVPKDFPRRRASDLSDDEDVTTTPRWGERATDAGRDTQEQVRVRADLLNDLVNFAGEVNIYHSRMGKQVSDIGFNLSELESTVVRLKEQLRNLEIETEIQIRSSYEKEREDDHYDADFDPLEMDRYSTIQQLSRSLGETAGDVESIKDILADITRDSETLLLQESRVSTELQEGLMRTRMVRFGGLGTRLRRIVRQTARELNKEVELEISGDTIEVDRTVLDRIIAPLEHMLRNAVAHGIEMPVERSKRGKPEAGTIAITVDRQGSDVLIKVKDDGSGINVDAIRKKALKQGLIEKDNQLSDHDVLQLILKSGFSTADSVSQIAGRGVGMDVVDSEIKQLGGMLEIDTRKGRGTEFVVRLPLTLAINQALLVNAGDDVYAIPLVSIEGVVRITGTELQRFYDSGHSQYEFNGIEYELKHLGNLLTGSQADYASQLRLFPVLLAKVGDKHFALHVDDLIGRREIVVKPVGLQLGTVRGIAGATILADGRVVLILEMSALVVGEALFKQTMEDQPQPEAVVPVEEKKETTVMVVDDSITIRKVTARMLERHGITVIAAKDGVDATNQLQERVPDLMLLDIEMPRMDGFELATYIRNDDKLKDLPIIMITSRTGSKHKEKAMEIGVNQYLGKPYQEEELMKNINELISVA